MNTINILQMNIMSKPKIANFAFLEGANFAFLEGAKNAL